MSEKTYTLELTAEELINIKNLTVCDGYGVPANGVIQDRLNALVKQARADREAEVRSDLRLPWAPFKMYAHDPKWVVDVNVNWKPGDPPGPPGGQYTYAQAKLMSAAPKLREALRLVERWRDGISACVSEEPYPIDVVLDALDEAE